MQKITLFIYSKLGQPSNLVLNLTVLAQWTLILHQLKKIGLNGRNRPKLVNSKNGK